VAGVPDTGFYITGGTLEADAPSYVERKADKALLDSLRLSEFCYVLDTRQVGKSSLVIRTASRLRKEGVHVGVLDLTEIGQNLTAEQWYYGLLRRIGEQLGLDEPLTDFWRKHKDIGPLHRWIAALEKVALPGIDGPVVIFIDEVDAVRSLPFSTDEFFAAIRECYNRRAGDPAFSRLTFCLVGVATPADLIRDVRTTPFNIGRRIELNDFTAEEAPPLAEGISSGGRDGRALLQRIMHWTGGHPYLTQRLCQAVSDSPDVDTPRKVDQACKSLFFSQRAQDTDDNLAFVRNRILRSEADLAALLDLYGQVRNRKRVEDDQQNPLVNLLHLSGIVRAKDRYLRVRNRVYEQVFNKSWILRNMPGAELRRQRAAYRKGLVRAAAISAVVLAVIGMLGINGYRLAQSREVALGQARKAERTATAEGRAKGSALLLAKTERDRSRDAERKAHVSAKAERTAAIGERAQRRVAQRATATAQQQTLRTAQTLYAADMNLAQNQFEAENLAATIKLLDAHRPGRDPVDLRGFEWYYLWGQSHADLMTLKAHSAAVFAAVPSPDGRLLVTTSRDKTIKIWDMKTWRLLKTIAKQAHTVTCAAFSPDGKSFVTGCADRTARIWETSTGRELLTITIPSVTGHGMVISLCLSPDGKRLATTSWNDEVPIWDIRTGRQLLSLVGHIGRVDSCAFSPEGSLVATASAGDNPSSGDNTVRIWNAWTGKEIRKLNFNMPRSVAFAPDSKHLAIGGYSRLEYQDITSGKTVWQGLLGRITPNPNTYAVSFSPNGKQVAVARGEGVFEIWDAADGSEIFSCLGHRDRIWSIRYSPDGKKLITAGWDGEVKVWDATGPRAFRRFDPSAGATFSVASSQNSRYIAADCASGMVKIWDVDTMREICSLAGRRQRSDGWDNLARSTLEWSRPCSVDFSPDGRTLLVLSENDGTTMWNLTTKRIARTFLWTGHRITSAKFSPDGKRIVTGTLDGTTILWDVYSGKKSLVLAGHTDKINSAVFSPDGTRVATASRDRTARVWDAATGRVLHILRAHTDEIASVAFSPDGRKLLTASWDKTVVLWDTSTGSKLASLIVSGAAVAQFLPSGLRAVCTDQGHAITWDLRSGRATWSDRPWGDGSLYSIAVSPDGRRIAAGGDVGGGVLMWTAATDAEIAAYERARGLVPSTRQTRTEGGKR